MKKLTIGLSVAALALAGTAYAASDEASQSRPDRNATVTRAEAQAHAAQMFARMDANKDGKLDAADREARHAAMFDRIDTNKDGQISREEFSAMHRSDGKRGGPEGRHRMGDRGGKGWGHHGGMMKGDGDQDKAITQAEFTAAALQRFDRMDANKDGQVTKEERQAGRSAMREQRKARTAPPEQPAN